MEDFYDLAFGPHRRITYCTKSTLMLICSNVNRCDGLLTGIWNDLARSRGVAGTRRTDASAQGTPPESVSH